MTHKTLGRAACLTLLLILGGPAEAPPCGNSAAGFEAWKRTFAGEAQARGVGSAGIAALMATNYSAGTIRADRGQKSFKLSLDQFMAKRGGPAIASQGKGRKAANAALLASLEKRYGVPAGPLIAIWGMETGFGSFMGNQPVISAVATLAYDCRRPEYFTDHLYAALQLVDRGMLSNGTRGAMHGEVGQTQFLPKSIRLHSQFPQRPRLDQRRGLSTRRAELRRNQRLERGRRLPAGDCDHWPADRRAIGHAR